jgi:hypothetical protein
MNNKMSLTFNFETHEDLQLFLIDINNLINKRSKPKKANDLRGSGTAELHKKVKEYKEANPEKSYRECLKEIAKPKPENNNIV